MSTASAPRPVSGENNPSFADLFTPKLVTVWREGYGLRDLRTDAIAGLTVAIVALPLSMAIAIASGVEPARGLYAAIFGGFLVSALGGSRFQIGGPAGAFIVLVAASAARHGVEGLLLAVLMSGLFMIAAGFLRLGTYIKFIPFPVTVGFTAGIAVIIAASQIHDLLGLQLTGEPAAILPKLEALVSALPSFTPAAVGIALFTMVTIQGLKRLRPGWPGMLIAVVLASAGAALIGLPVETIGTRFGGIPSGIPLPGLPEITLAKVQAVLPDALAFTLLGAIESLLSAVVADGMTGRRHRSNCELVAQGAANISSALFGGICVTGTIARTATNVRAGARGPVSGMIHSLTLLAFVLVAAPLAAYIPLAALAGVLMLVAWNMVEKHAIGVLLRTSLGDAVVLMTTFGLTVFRDLTEGILAGVLLGAMLFIHRMSQAMSVEAQAPFAPEDRADSEGVRDRYDASLAANPDVVVYRLSGAFFFGAAATVGSVLDRIADQRKLFILDFAAVPFLDSTAANAIASAVTRAERHGIKPVLTGMRPQVADALAAHDVTPPRIETHADIDAALNAPR